MVLSVSGDRLVSFKLPNNVFEDVRRNMFTTRYVPIKQKVHSISVHKYTLDEDRRVSRMIGDIDMSILPVFRTIENTDSRVFFIPEDVDPRIRERATARYNSIIDFNNRICNIIKKSDDIEAFRDEYHSFYVPGDCGKLLVTSLLDAIVFGRKDIVSYMMKVDESLVAAQESVIEAALRVSEVPEFLSPMEIELRDFFYSRRMTYNSTGSVPDKHESERIEKVVYVSTGSRTGPEPEPYTALPDRGTMPYTKSMTIESGSPDSKSFVDADTTYTSAPVIDTASSDIGADAGAGAGSGAGAGAGSGADRPVLNDPVLPEPEARFVSEPEVRLASVQLEAL